MTGMNVFRNPVRQYRVVVVLQASQAYWFKWQGSELIDTFVETLRLDALNKEVRCPWIQSDSDDAIGDIELVLDTALEELDRIQLETTAPGVVQAWKKRQLVKYLYSDHPESTVSVLPSYMFPDVLSIVHHVLPDSFRLWIQQLQEQHVHVSHVATATEILSASVKKRVGPALIVHGSISDRRHLLVDGMALLHMRGIDVDSTDGNADRDGVSDEYIANIKTEILKDQHTLEVIVPSLERPGRSSEFSAAHVLAALVVGCPVDMKQPMYSLEEPRTDTRNASSKDSFYAGKFMSLHTAIRQFFSRYIAPLDQGARRSWRVSHRRRVAASVLQPSHVNSRLIARIGFLQKATLVCTAIATVTFALASVHGMQAARDRSQLNAEQVRLHNQMVPMNESLSVLHRSPAYASLSIERIEQFNESRAADPVKVLATIASAMTKSPSLQLDNLSWSTLGDHVSGDIVFTTEQGVTSREDLWQSGDSRPQVLVELSGNFIGNKGLREQQLEFEAFISYLESLPGMDTIKVLESPLNTARSSELLANSHTGYRISLVLEAG